MRRTEVYVTALVAVGLIAAGLTWLFGAFGLLGVGAFLGAVALIVDVKDN